MNMTKFQPVCIKCVIAFFYRHIIIFIFIKNSRFIYPQRFDIWNFFNILKLYQIGKKVLYIKYIEQD